MRYLKQDRRVLYTDLLTSGKRNSYLVDIDKLALNLFPRLVKKLSERESITDELKAEQPMNEDDSQVGTFVFDHVRAYFPALLPRERKKLEKQRNSLSNRLVALL